jgi:hypothetical protein
MIIMVTPWLYKWTAHLAHFGVVKVDELDEGVLQKQAGMSIGMDRPHAHFLAARSQPPDVLQLVQPPISAGRRPT